MKRPAMTDEQRRKFHAPVYPTCGIGPNGFPNAPAGGWETPNATPIEAKSFAEREPRWLGVDDDESIDGVVTKVTFQKWAWDSSRETVVVAIVSESDRTRLVSFPLHLPPPSGLNTVISHINELKGKRVRVHATSRTTKLGRTVHLTRWESLQ